MNISEEIVKKLPNDLELGSYIRSIYPDEKIVKENPNNFVLGALVRKMTYEKNK